MTGLGGFKIPAAHVIGTSPHAGIGRFRHAGVEAAPKQAAFAAGGVPHSHGLFTSDVPGRTDKLNVNVPAEGYVIPADIVSALGQGNTLAGKSILDRLFGPVPSGMAHGGTVPIVVAGGEYYVHPAAVQKIGDGDMKRGHDVLDEFVKHIRAKTVKKLKSLPSPRGSKKKK